MRAGLQMVEIARRFPVKALEVVQHRPEPGPDQVALLGEQAGEIAARVFEAPVVEGHREGHVRGLRRHLQMGEERGEVRVGPFVVDDEPGVDRDVAVGAAHGDGIRMAADPAVAFEDGDVVAPAEQPGGGHA